MVQLMKKILHIFLMPDKEVGVIQNEFSINNILLGKKVKKKKRIRLIEISVSF